MKLIRDKIPSHMRSNGYTPTLMTVDDDAKLGWLLQKLAEECGEAVASGGDLMELADVLEVCRSIWGHKCGYASPLPMDGLLAAMERKHEARGGFDKGYLWLNDSDISAAAVAARTVYSSEEAP